MKVKKQKPIALRVVFTPFKENRRQGYTVEVPELQGCISEGDNPEQAERMIRDAVECYLHAEISPAPVPKGAFEKTLYLAWVTQDGKPLKLSPLPAVVSSLAGPPLRKKRKHRIKAKK